MIKFVGKSLGRYHVLEPLGEGGMANVYKAFDTHLEAEVAVKVIRIDELPPKILDRTLKRFEREAKCLVRLNRPNIIIVYEREGLGMGKSFGRYRILEQLDVGMYPKSK